MDVDSVPEIGTFLTEEAEALISESILYLPVSGEFDRNYVANLPDRIRRGELGLFTLSLNKQVCGLLFYRSIDREADLVYGYVRRACAGKERLFLEKVLKMLQIGGIQVVRSGFSWQDAGHFRTAAESLSFHRVSRLSMLKPVDENLMFSYAPAPGITIIPWSTAYFEEVCQIMYEESTPEDRSVYPLFGTPEGSRLLLLSIIRDMHGQFIPELSLLAQFDGEIAGFVITSLLNDGSVLILDIAVKSKFRRRGIGTKMIESLASKCAVTGRNAIVLAVTVQNESAISLYKKTGFRETGRFDQYVKMISTGR